MSRVQNFSALGGKRSALTKTPNDNPLTTKRVSIQCQDAMLANNQLEIAKF